ncbi:Kae1-associated serine/threonine protein kinase [Candidatus Woesearchaeota archaeon]|nr:Kae1-associated serine/threonine protein kinase [Candidatus Woesearchaeota archaeon]
MNSKMFAQGAEAKLYRKNNIAIKDRTKKSYRLPEIDKRLRKSRTKKEAKILEKLYKLNFPAPKLIHCSEDKIDMEFLDGPKLRDVLEKSDYQRRSKEIGKKLAFLHNHDIIHQDLTTSNIIQMKELYFIDFGLSFFSQRIEDKAVDIHLFRQALESKHYTIWKECFKTFLEEYKKHANQSKEILERYGKVASRGRNKQAW